MHTHTHTQKKPSSFLLYIVQAEWLNEQFLTEHWKWEYLECSKLGQEGSYAKTAASDLTLPLIWIVTENSKQREALCVTQGNSERQLPFENIILSFTEAPEGGWCSWTCHRFSGSHTEKCRITSRLSCNFQRSFKLSWGWTHWNDSWRWQRLGSLHFQELAAASQGNAGKVSVVCSSCKGLKHPQMKKQWVFPAWAPIPTTQRSLNIPSAHSGRLHLDASRIYSYFKASGSLGVSGLPAGSWRGAHRTFTWMHQNMRVSSKKELRNAGQFKLQGK